MDFPDELEVVIEVPRGGFIKRKDDGSVDFISPAPCPFNYGSVPGTLSGDGDRIDAVVLGSRRARGSRLKLRVVGRVRFTDAGQDDPKYICSNAPMSPGEKLQISAFFGFYAQAKRVLNFVRGVSGRTSYGGIEER